MHIVQLANLVHPISGGRRAVIEQLGAAYLAAGHRRAVVTAGPTTRHRVDHDGTVRVQLRAVPVPASGGHHLLVDRGRVGRILASLAPDAVELSDRATLTWVTRWARARGIPATVLLHERLDHTIDACTPTGVDGARIARRADRLLLRSPARLVAPSRFAAAPFAARATVVPWGVDTTTFHPARRERAERPGLTRLVWIGPLSREKRPDLAIDTLRRLRASGIAADLTVVGDGPLHAHLRRRAGGLPVHFLGHRPTLEVAAALANADVSLATCPHEAFGLAALEALACGTPVATVSTGALPELLGLPVGRPDTTPAGATASPTPQAMAYAVERLLRIQPAQRRAAARARALTMDWSATQRLMLAHHTSAPSLAAVV